MALGLVVLLVWLLRRFSLSKFLIDLKIAFRNLVQHQRRTLFLGLAIAAVTALLVLLNGLSTGVRETMIDTATTLSTGHVNVGGFYKVTAGQAAPVVTDYQKVLEVVKKAVPEMAFAVQRGRGWAKVVSDTGSMQLGITGHRHQEANRSSPRCCRS